MKKEQSNVASLEPNVDSLRSNVASKEPQNLAWACLPKEARNQIRDIVKTSGMGIHGMFDLVFGGNVTSDVEPEEMLMVSKKRVLTELCRAVNLQNDKEEDWIRAGEEIEFTLMQLFGDKCLPDKEQPKPKCDIGQKVKIKGTKQIGTIKEPYSNDNDYRVYFEDGDGGWDEEYSAEDLESYTEESRNLSQNIANCDKSEDNQLKDNMEEKELNLVALLRGCEGEEFYSIVYGNVTLEVIHSPEVDDPKYYLLTRPNSCRIGRDLVYPNGKVDANGAILLYPSKELYEKYPLDAYAAWQEWKEARKPKRWRAKKYQGYYYIDIIGGRIVTKYDTDEREEPDNNKYDSYNYFRTEEEAQQAAEVVRETLQKFHEKNAER